MITVGDKVMLCLAHYYPLEAEVVREPREGDELWYLKCEFIHEGKKSYSLQAINPRSSEFVRMVKHEIL